MTPFDPKKKKINLTGNKWKVEMFLTHWNFHHLFCERCHGSVAHSLETWLLL